MPVCRICTQNLGVRRRLAINLREDGRGLYAYNGNDVCVLLAGEISCTEDCPERRNGL